MSSRTSTVPRPASTSSSDGSGRRASDASAPRWTWKPVTSSASASLTTKQGAAEPVEHIGQAVQPPRRHEERPGGVAGRHGAAYDLLALGQEQPVLGLEVLAQLDVTQVPVVGQPRIRRVGDLDQLGHVAPGPKRSGCATATTSPITMIAGGATPLSGEVGCERAQRGQHGPLPRHAAVADDRDRGVGLAPAGEQRLGDRWCVLTAIISTRVPVRAATASQSVSESGCPGRKVTGDDGELVGHATVGDRNAGERRYGYRAGQPRYDGDGHTRRPGRPRPPRSLARRRSCRRP